MIILSIIISGSLSAAVSKTNKKVSTEPGTMITIPEGDFLMGNSGVGEWAGGYDQFPQHSVFLDTYQIGKYEVTRGEYRKFIDEGGYDNSTYWSTNGFNWKVKSGRTQPKYWAESQNWGTGTFIQTDRHPVVGVTYYEAEAYCKWAGGRLPTEGEWEKAARWTGTYPNVYPWGDKWDQEKCNNIQDSNSAGGGVYKHQTAPVGSYANDVSPYGCQDMAGNVEEWCSDWFKSYPGAVEPFDFISSGLRSTRGGGWLFVSNLDSRCAERGQANVPLCGTGDYGQGSETLGFRIAR